MIYNIIYVQVDEEDRRIKRDLNANYSTIVYS